MQSITFPENPELGRCIRQYPSRIEDLRSGPGVQIGSDNVDCLSDSALIGATIS